MSEMRFSGIPAGPADLTVAQAGQTASLVTTATETTGDAVTDAFYLQREPVAQGWRGLSATRSEGNGTDLGWGFAPPVFREMQQATGDHPNRVILGNINDFTYTPLIYQGGRADVYRLRNGEIVRIRSSQITGGNWGAWRTLNTLSSSGYTLKFPNFYASGARYHYRVAAIDGSGQLGDSALAFYDLPETRVAGPSATNTNVISLSQTEGGSLAAPTNFTISTAGNGNDSLVMTWDDVPGAVGYAIFEAYSDPANFVDDRHVELAADGGDPVTEGDMVILTHRIQQIQPGMKSPRVLNDFPTTRPLVASPVFNPLNLPGEGMTHTYGDWTGGDAAPASGLGDSYMTAVIEPGSGSQTVLEQFWAAAATQSFYRVPNPNELYRWRCWVEADRAVQVTFSSGLAGDVTQTVNLVPGWQEVNLTFTPIAEPTGTGIRRWRFSVADRGTGVTLRLAGLQLHEDSTPYHGAEPAIAELIPPGTILRDHSLIKPGRKTTDLTDLTNPPGVSPRQHTLETNLRICAANGAEPWLQIEWYHTEEEWLDILAFLAAPVSSGHPMALKRQQNGRTAPWTDAFDQIRIEFGNEAWNGLSEFWNPPASMPDEVLGGSRDRAHIFGRICRNAALAMQASAYWTDKIVWVLGGRSGNDFSNDIARSFNLPCEIGIANYNGGWDVGNTLVNENESSYRAILNVVPAQTSRGIDKLTSDLADVAEEADIDLEFGTTLVPTCYEAGPGYQLNGLNGASVTAAETITQEVVMKSQATATGTLDTMLYQAVRGFRMFNYFQITTGNFWSARASTVQGGGIFPAFEAVRIVMEQMGPCDVLGTRGAGLSATTVTDQGGDDLDVSAVAVYGLRSIAHPDRIMLVVLNRSPTDALPISVLSAIKAVDAMTVWTFTDDYRFHNRYPVGTRLQDDDTYVADANCKEITYDPIVMPVPADPGRFDIGPGFGLPGLEDGLPAGAFMLIRLDGVVFDA